MFRYFPTNYVWNLSVDLAIEIVSAAQAARWAPIRHHDVLHDRASYRYFWQVLELSLIHI